MPRNVDLGEADAVPRGRRTSNHAPGIKPMFPVAPFPCTAWTICAAPDIQERAILRQGWPVVLVLVEATGTCRLPVRSNTPTL